MNVKDSIKIVWVDDEPSHEEDARTLESRRKELEIEFISPLKFEGFLEKHEDGVDLFLVDDKLILRGETTSTSFNRRGLSVAAQFREKFPEIPIYLFSAYKEKGIYTTLAEAAESLADDILDLKTIQRKGHDILYHDAIDYRRIRGSRRESVDSLFSLLYAPEDDRERIFFALPESLKNGLSPQSETKLSYGNAIAFAKWTKRTFLKLPGFVYNSLYSATKLGITEDAFKDLASEFEDANYIGVFAKTSPKLWWDFKLRKIIFQLANEKLPEDDTTDLRILTPKLFSLDESQTSKCIVCGERYPETVGINKDDDEDYRPVHYRCSDPHPTKARVLYFEEARQFSKKE